MRNVHQRVIHADTATVGRLLDTLAGPGDQVWPRDVWPPMLFDRPLQVGAVGGHGDIRYTVAEYVPGSRVLFRFDPGVGLDGTHLLEVVPVAEGALVRHVIEGRLYGPMVLLWPFVVRGMHDAVLEDLLDRVELNATGTVAKPAHWTPKTRLLRAAFKRVAARRPSAGQLVAPGAD